jgi:23S rRNA (adenine2503-C2)-methyltransferase
MKHTSTQKVDFSSMSLYCFNMENISKTNLKNLSLDEMISLATNLRKKRYTGRQLYKWIFKHGETEFGAMTDLSKSFRELLRKRYYIGQLVAVNNLKSADGTVKTVWEIDDSNYIESVLIPDGDRLTLCVSSQAGCPLGCSFCATGLSGFRRNLLSGEIYDQYLLTKSTLDNQIKITNIVFMGMGEPFLNYDNVMKAINAFTNELGASISAKRITVSTVGIVDGIYRLADELSGLKLAISLHSAKDEIRNKLIPIAKKFPLAKLKEAAKHYAEKSGSRVSFEYLLIKNINDSLDDARALASFIRAIPCKINLITYNPVEGSKYQRPDKQKVLAFRDYLYPRAPAVTLRKSKGVDISAACGQLAGHLSS